jgi:hypothetical protein
MQPKIKAFFKRQPPDPDPNRFFFFSLPPIENTVPQLSLAVLYAPGRLSELHCQFRVFL